ncbi:MAG: hypothetical protein AABY10_01145 [Nanoarchaeota archaeon]
MKKTQSWKFGDTKKEADLLLKLVIAEKKKATSFKKPKRHLHFNSIFAAHIQNMNFVFGVNHC